MNKLQRHKVHSTLYRRSTRESWVLGEKQYRLLFEQNPQPMWIFDPKTLAFLEVNEAATIHYGYSYGEFMGMTLADIRPPEDIELLQKSVQEHRDHLDAQHVWRHYKKDRTLLYVRVVTSDLTFARRPARLAAIQDVTQAYCLELQRNIQLEHTNTLLQVEAQERNRIEFNFRQSEERFKSIFDHAPIGIVVADPSCRLQLVNRAFCELLGYPASELLDKTCAAVSYPPDLVIEAPFAHRLILGEIQSYQLEKRFVKQDKTLLYGQLTITAVRNEQGQLLYILGMVMDISQRKQAETDLQKANQNLATQMVELKRIDNVKNDFLSTVSHELRTPLSNMNIALALLKSKHTTQAKKNLYLQTLEYECRREINLVNDLLDLQSLEIGQRPLVFTSLDLELWLPSLLRIIQERALLRQQTLTLALPPDLEPFVTDNASLERIILELVNNALKYTPEGGLIQVAVSQIAHEYRFQVTNSGPGIPKSELNRIFEKFYRIPNADPWRQSGTGLGLALILRLIEALQGTITVTSDRDLTCFTVRLPQGVL